VSSFHRRISEHETLPEIPDFCCATVAIVLQVEKRGQEQFTNPLNLLTSQSGLGHYGRNFFFFLRNLPFELLTQHIREAFPP
jgi:hypothetical protein